MCGPYSEEKVSRRIHRYCARIIYCLVFLYVVKPVARWLDPKENLCSKIEWVMGKSMVLPLEKQPSDL